MSCHLPRLQLPWGGGWPCDVGGHTSLASWNWKWAPVLGAASFATLQTDLASPRINFWGFLSSTVCTVQTVCNTENSFLWNLCWVLPVLVLLFIYFFKGRWYSHDVKFTIVYGVISWCLAHPIMSQPPPVCSFKIFSSSPKKNPCRLKSLFLSPLP